MTTNLWACPFIALAKRSSFKTIHRHTPPAANGVADEDKSRKRVNVEATIANLVGLGALPDEEQESLEHYMLSVEEILKRYEKCLQEWPLLVAQRLIKMQVSRLKYIKYALTEKLNNHPVVLC